MYNTVSTWILNLYKENKEKNSLSAVPGFAQGLITGQNEPCISEIVLPAL